MEDLQEKITKIKIQLKEGARPPQFASSGASGADIRAFIEKPIVLNPGNRTLIPTGVFTEIPNGFEIQIRPRSGLALKHGITVLNTPGTIDSDYRGELKILLVNLGEEPFEILPQMRIAQLVIAKIEKTSFSQEPLTSSVRGSGGFGHSGTN